MRRDIQAFLKQHGSEFRVEESQKFFSVWEIPGGTAYDRAVGIRAFISNAEEGDRLALRYDPPPEMSLCSFLASTDLLRLDYQELAAFMTKHRRGNPDKEALGEFYHNRINLGKEFVTHFKLEDSLIPWVQKLAKESVYNGEAAYLIRKHTIGTNPPVNIRNWTSE